MTNIITYSKIKIDKKGVGGVVVKALKVLKGEGIFTKKRYELSVAFVSTGRMKFLNKKFRKKDNPTNVLSFDYGNEGEIIICPEIVKKEAKKQGNSFDFQLKWMIIHGLLHLAGVNHWKSKKAEAVFIQIEQMILGKIRNII